ncbi:TetR/AcrR family transcriptional regulator [Lactobacillus sp.] [Lactiplantibacillus mudanjiangensis]|uniref:TetR/AcrR family transcriptional regulator n=1 Tax=Lactiplantibacillus mudanjiangensis TaxID=1296538 RepID=UPI00101449A3|nr:TetR/AcrR family transcriptional regulator [Lactiplantibacillus mudanjiangensis]VDG19563.1 TetR/AcrR family transcriptional regulator [Lactobacillus sp.] [Lactiplantibacillus mudanjiangensis]VDG31011.1 TetR/AcrR family transcriptional regulator [Lactobacillus sp.] [Lactiplantibacillus mudanjiangensis]
MQVNNLETLFKKTLATSKLTAKQQAVLQVSLNLFSEQGFDGTSTSEIAKAAGVSEGTVFKQFKTKAGILEALLNPVLDDVLPMAAGEFLTEMNQSDLPNFQQLLQYMIADRMKFVLENQKQIRVFAQEIIRNPKIIQTLQVRAAAMIKGEAGDFLQQYKDSGQLVDWPSGRIIQYLLGTIISYVAPQVLLVPTKDFDIQQASTEAAEFLARGLAPQN